MHASVHSMISETERGVIVVPVTLPGQLSVGVVRVEDS